MAEQDGFCQIGEGGMARGMGGEMNRTQDGHVIAGFGVGKVILLAAGHASHRRRKGAAFGIGVGGLQCAEVGLVGGLVASRQGAFVGLVRGRGHRYA